MALQGGEIFVSFLGRQIVGQNSVSASRRGSFGKFLKTHLQNGIEIAEQDQRRVRTRAQMADEFEHAGESRSAAQCAFAGTLDDGTIRHRIAEWDAEFDNVGAGFSGGQYDFGAGFERRISGGNVGYQAEFAGVGKCAKSSFDSPGTFFGVWRFFRATA